MVSPHAQPGEATAAAETPPSPGTGPFFGQSAQEDICPASGLDRTLAPVCGRTQGEACAYTWKGASN